MRDKDFERGQGSLLQLRSAGTDLEHRCCLRRDCNRASETMMSASVRLICNPSDHKEEAREGTCIERQTDLQLSLVQATSLVLSTAYQMHTVVYRPSLAHILGNVVLP